MRRSEPRRATIVVLAVVLIAVGGLLAAEAHSAVPLHSSAHVRAGITANTHHRR